MMRGWAALLGALLAACGNANDHQTLPAEDVVSGYTFLTPETQALQDDDFENPGYLWVDKGETLFASGGTPCASCHEGGLVGAAATYPKIDTQTGALINLEGRINICRERHQSLPTLGYESDELLALTAYMAAQSRGVAQSAQTSGAAARHYEAGKAYFFTRRGQLNLACSTCHDDNWGKKLRGDTISQGHGNGFPAYRLEWQSLGSLHRRMSDCDVGVRADPFALGSQEYLDLELYLAARSGGLAVEAPAVRR